MFWFIPIILGSLAAGAGAGIVAGLICAVISELLTEDTISDAIHNESQFKNAFKAIINDKTTRTVKVGIFGSTEKIGDMEIESSKGVSDSLHVGQVIYL